MTAPHHHRVLEAAMRHGAMREDTLPLLGVGHAESLPPPEDGEEVEDADHAVLIAALRREGAVLLDRAWGFGAALRDGRGRG